MELIVDWKGRGETEESTVLDLLDFIEKEVRIKELAMQLRKDCQVEPPKPAPIKSLPTVSQFVAATDIHSRERPKCLLYHRSFLRTVRHVS